MRFDVPQSFSPSSLAQFTTCPLAYRFSYVERRPQPPSLAATKGSIVHRALELLFLREPLERTIENALDDLDAAFVEYQSEPDLINLHLDDAAQKKLESDSRDLVERYFQLEDPTLITPIGLELKLEATIGDTVIRGVIDRLERDNDGGLIVTDYKTGSVPRAQSESSKMSGVNLYASLCEQIFGQLPSKVQLLYLSQPVSIEARPSASTIRGVAQKSSAIHKAVIRSCEKGDFRPNVSVLCGWCGYKDLCPAQGGTLPE
jgi:putative RecB family exonuclease